MAIPGLLPARNPAVSDSCDPAGMRVPETACQTFQGAWAGGFRLPAWQSAAEASRPDGGAEGGGST